MKKVFVVGRQPAPQYLGHGEVPIILSDTPETQHVSRSHARITVQDNGQMTIEDLQSTSGTFVGGVRIQHPTQVSLHDRITFGSSYRFSLDHPALHGAVGNSGVDNIVYASWTERLGAFMLDVFFIVLMMLPLRLILTLGLLGGGYGPGSSAGDLLEGIAWILIIQFYIAAPLAKRGSTYGKRLVGLKVIRQESRENLGLGQAWGRELGRYLSVLILFIGYLMPLWTEKKQALHDFLVGSVVVKSRT